MSTEQRVPFLLPDTEPPSFKNRAKWGAMGLFGIACAALLCWYTVKVGNQNWKSATSALSYQNGWPPILRQFGCALSAALLLFCGIVSIWKAVRPGHPKKGRDGN